VLRLPAALLCMALIASAETGGAIAQKYYEQLIQQGRVSGAYFAEVSRGDVTETSAFGQVRSDSLWRGASTSKLLTALGVMNLVEQGRLDLDVDVNRYLRTFKVPATKSRPITLRYLLTHTSGLDDPFVGSGFTSTAGTQPPLSMEMRNYLPTRLYEPGTVRLYSNYGYGLAGAIIEDVTGRRFEEFMLTEVLEPLGMLHSTFQQPLPAALELRVVPSLERNLFGFTRPAPIIYHRASAAGGVTTTFADLLLLARFVQGKGLIGGRQFLQPLTLRMMLGGSPDSSGDAESYGFGIGIKWGERYWYAGGDLAGYHTVLLWFPDHDRALVTLAASASNVATWNLVPKLMEAWFGSSAKADSVRTASLPDAHAVAARVAGTYRPVRYPHHDLAKTFVITMDQSVRANPDGSITYGGERWIAVDPLRFRNSSDTLYLTFQQDAGGHIRFLNRDSERIAWYQSGRATIMFYFGFVVLSVAVLVWSRGRGDERALRWMAWAILIHSVAWLGAALVADPQRLILGIPWYLKASLLFGALVPPVWIYLAASTLRGIVGRSWPLPAALGRVAAMAALSLYIPFALYWQLFTAPTL
jgi:CubicO group peptidase (beta-lactamase class C family)